MRKSLISGLFLILSAGGAEAGSIPRYNSPPANYHYGTLPGPTGDISGSLPPITSMRRAPPLITKSGIVPPPPPPLPTWTGVNLGVNIGAGWANARLDVPGLASFSGVGMHGAAGGVTAGFDYQFFPQIVAGVIAEGNVNSTSASGSIAGLGEANFREDASWALRGRLGTLTSDETMVYVTAGVSEVFTHLSFPNTPGVQGGDVRYMGAIFGAGIETRLDGGLYARVEYLHGLYDRRWFAGGLFSATPEASLARVGLIFKPAEFAATGVSNVPPMRENWTGPYAGAHVGWGWESTGLSGPNWTANGVGGSGPIGGLLVGYEYQFGSAVAALEADGSGAGIKSSLSVLNLNAKVNYNWDYSIRARFGRLFGNTLAFASVGWSQTGGELTTAGLGGLQTSHAFSGVQFGGGLETMVTPHIGARLEYLQTYYDKYAAILGSSVDARPTAGKTRAAVVYKF